MRRALVMWWIWMALAGAAACGEPWKARYQVEQQRRRFAELQLRRNEGEIRRSQQIIRRQQRRLARLEQELGRMRQLLARTQPRATEIARPPVHRPSPPAGPRPPAYMSLGDVRFWNPSHRRQRKRVAAALGRLLPQWRACYRRFGWGQRGELPLRGTFWLIYALKERKIIKPRRWISGMIRFQPGGIVDRRYQTRAVHLESCVNRSLRSIRARSGPKLLRIAIRLVVADTALEARKVRPRPFHWPWKRITRRTSGVRQICSEGRRRRTDPLAPPKARPCKAGLRCCYPCGIPGCNSICLPRCPVGIP